MVLVLSSSNSSVMFSMKGHHLGAVSRDGTKKVPILWSSLAIKNNPLLGTKSNYLNQIYAVDISFWLDVCEDFARLFVVNLDYF